MRSSTPIKCMKLGLKPNSDDAFGFSTPIAVESICKGNPLHSLLPPLTRRVGPPTRSAPLRFQALALASASLPLISASLPLYLASLPSRFLLTCSTLQHFLVYRDHTSRVILILSSSDPLLGKPMYACRYCNVLTFGSPASCCQSSWHPQSPLQ